MATVYRHNKTNDLYLIEYVRVGKYISQKVGYQASKFNSLNGTKEPSKPMTESGFLSFSNLTVAYET